MAGSGGGSGAAKSKFKTAARSQRSGGVRSPVVQGKSGASFPRNSPQGKTIRAARVGSVVRRKMNASAASSKRF